MQDTLEDQHWTLNHWSQGYITLADLSGLNTALRLLLASDPHISGLKNENVELSKGFEILIYKIYLISYTEMHNISVPNWLLVDITDLFLNILVHI